jgi:hypothetical protein
MYFRIIQINRLIARMSVVGPTFVRDRCADLLRGFPQMKLTVGVSIDPDDLGGSMILRQVGDALRPGFSFTFSTSPGHPVANFRRYSAGMAGIISAICV